MFALVPSRLEVNFVQMQFHLYVIRYRFSTMLTEFGVTTVLYVVLNVALVLIQETCLVWARVAMKLLIGLERYVRKLAVAGYFIKMV